MKPALILSLAVFLLVSCRSNYTTYEYAPLNSVIKRYSFEYYMLPENIGKVIQYLERLKRESPDTYYYSEPYLEGDLADILKSNKFKYEYLKDSVFVYDKKNRDRYLVRGNPYYWLGHPDAYPEELHDYWSYYRPAFYDEEGNHIYEFDESEFGVHSGDRYDAICRYDRVGDIFSISAGIVDYYIPDYDTLLTKRIIGVRDTVSAFIRKNPKVYSCIFPIQLSKTGTLWAPKDAAHLYSSRDTLVFKNGSFVIDTGLFEEAHLDSPFQYVLKDPGGRKIKATFTIVEGHAQMPELFSYSECIDNREIYGLSFKCYRRRDLIYACWYDATHDLSYICEDSFPEDIVNLTSLIRQVRPYNSGQIKGR